MSHGLKISTQQWQVCFKLVKWANEDLIEYSGGKKETLVIIGLMSK